MENIENKNIENKRITLLGKFYLRNKFIIKDKITFSEASSKKEIEDFITNFKESLKYGFRENADFQFTFGQTTFRGSELVAFSIVVEGEEIDYVSN